MLHQWRMCRIDTSSHHRAHIQYKQVDQVLPSHTPALSDEWFELSSQILALDESCPVIQEQLQAFQVGFECLVAQDPQCDADKMFQVEEHPGGQKKGEQCRQGRWSLTVG